MNWRELIAKALMPMKERQFYNNYSQHLDLRNRANPEAAAVAQRQIVEEGFRGGANVNTLPPYRGGEPHNVVDRKFAPRTGDTVYLVPNSVARETGSGQAIAPGWKPAPHEVLQIERDFPALYQEYLRGVLGREQYGSSIRPFPGAFEP